jgi:4-amino-4-deoxy-L-arabinose transferase-like glycosyltransferase
MSASPRSALLLALVIWIGLLALTPATTLWDRDEPRFAQAAVEMLRSGDYLVPTFNGELRAQKPPLVYWLMTASMRLFGPSEFAARFWSPFGIAVAALATFAVGRRFWSARVGLVAMAVLALTPMAAIEGVLATADALLLASIATSVASIGALLQEPRVRVWRGLALGLTLGAGLLIKGPVALVLPIGIGAAAILLAGRAAPPRAALAATLAGASAIAVAIYAAWLIPASNATGGDIIRRGLVYENLDRALRPMEGHGTPWFAAPFYYPLVMAIAFAPWTWPLATGARRLVRSDGIRSLRCALLLAWIAVPTVAFTVAATKLPHYVFPVWPALSLVAAAALAGDTNAAWDHVRVRRYAGAAGATLAVVFAGAVAMDRFKPVPAIAAHVRAANAAGPLLTYGFDEPSLVFYTQRRVSPVAGDAARRAFVDAPHDAVVVASRDALAAAERTHGPLPLRELAAVRGWNVGNGTEVELVALLRRRER